MLYSETLREAVVALLAAAGTLAETRVYSPRDWPLAGPILPAILVDDTHERSDSRGNAGFPAFLTVATIAVGARVEETTAEAAKADLATLRAQIKNAVLTNIALISMIEQVVSVDTRSVVTSENRKHIGEMQMDFEMKYPEDFEPADPPALEGANIYVDLTEPADLSGTYTPPFNYPVPAAPRTDGPDGRVEGGLTLNLGS